MSAPQNGVKNGFFGYIKGLFRKNESDFATSEYDDTRVVTTLPHSAPPVEIAPVASVQAPASVAAAPVARANDNLDSRDGTVAPSVSVLLQPIIDGLNNELRSRVRSQSVGDAMVNIATDKVLSQLAQGQVRVPFGDIRKSAPQYFKSDSGFDRVSVSIPLNEILSRINPALLIRRTANRVVEVPDDITSPFAGNGDGLSLSASAGKNAPHAAAKTSAPSNAGRNSISFVPTPKAPSTPPPISFAPLKQSLSSHVPTATDVPEQMFTFNKPAGASQPAPAAQAKPQPIAQPAPVASSAPAITIPLSTLSETWPQPVRQEIAQANLSQSQVGLPVDSIETALKRGRVVFNWKTIRGWIRPATPGVVSVHDSVELDLPLKVVAPLFLARKQSTSAAASKVAVDEAIPNIFFGFPQPEAAPVPTPAHAAPARPSLIQPQSTAPAAQSAIPFGLTPSAPAATASLAAASSAVAAAAVSAAAAAATVNAAASKIADTNYYLWEEASDTQMLHVQALKQKGTNSTEFTKRYSSPSEIVDRASSFAGVAGVLVALPDGLMVASKLPAELNGDTLAAFLPQIFSKVSSCTKELRMGDLNNVSFTVGNVPWKIFRVNAIFFAAFGTAGQQMPTVQLAALAGELDRKSK